MLKKSIFLSCILLTTGLFSFTPKEPARALRTVIIDPGHGGADQGAKGLHATEAQLALQMAMKLGKQIEKEMPGIRVLYTRTTDIFPGNSPTKRDGDRYRASFANQSSADLFISIHLNSAGKAPGGWYDRKIVSYQNKTTYKGKGSKKKKVVTRVPVFQPYWITNEVKGTETFIWTAQENAHKEEMVVLNEFSSEDSSDTAPPENDPAINALKLIYTKKYFARSLRFADLVQQEFERSGRINRGVKQRNEKGIWVLHATGMPSVLVETGFISNKEEEQYMISEEGQTEIVDDIVAALKIYAASAEPQPPTAPTSMKYRVEGTEAFLRAIDERESSRNVK